MARNTEFLNGAWRLDEGDANRYFAGTGQNGIGTQGGATLQVTHPKERYDDYTQYDDRDYGAEKDNGRMWLKAADVDNKQQIPLFTHDEEPAVIHIGGATKESSGKLLDLVAQAKKDMQERLPGSKIVADRSLSDHSGPMANRAMDLGLIHGIQGREPGERWEKDDSNDIDWARSHDWIQDAANSVKRHLSGNGWGPSPEPIDIDSMSSVKRDAIAKASRDKRASINSPRAQEFKSGTSSQGEQITIPGFEKI